MLALPVARLKLPVRKLPKEGFVGETAGVIDEQKRKWNQPPVFRVVGFHLRYYVWLRALDCSGQSIYLVL